jgi:hypothetical protein
MSIDAASPQDQGRTALSSSIARSVVGVITCSLASIPLAIGFSLWGFYVHRADREWNAGYVLISTAVVVFFSLVIATFCAVCVGIPTYVLASRFGRWRPLVLLLGAVVAAVAFHEIWNGDGLFENLESTLQFAFFGLYSGVAFWLGADIWQLRK